jgi:hypothetical protein
MGFVLWLVAGDFCSAGVGPAAAVSAFGFRRPRMDRKLELLELAVIRDQGQARDNE